MEAMMEAMMVHVLLVPRAKDVLNQHLNVKRFLIIGHKI
jgi:hypothetical protein